MDAKDGLLFSDAMEQIRKARLAFGQDRWERWVRCRLVLPAERIEGTNSYGLPFDQWERLKRLVVIDHQLHGRKSPEALAYYAALWGIDVPADLVADHLIKSIHTLYRMTRRRIIRQSSGLFDPKNLYEEDIRKLAVKAANDVVQIFPIKNPVKFAIAKQFMEELHFVIFQMVYRPRPFPSFGAAVRRVASGIFRGPAVALGARFLRNALKSDSPRFVDPEVGNNQILGEIRATERDRPELILRACRDSGVAFLALRRGLGIKEDQPPRTPRKLSGVESENARFMFAVLPTISAFFLAINLDTPRSHFLLTLRKSEGKDLEKQIGRIDRIAEWQRRRLERGL